MRVPGVGHDMTGRFTVPRAEVPPGQTFSMYLSLYLYVLYAILAIFEVLSFKRAIVYRAHRKIHSNLGSSQIFKVLGLLTI